MSLLDAISALSTQLRLWPGQGALVENQLVRRVVAAMREVEPDYPDWKVAVTYRALSLLAPVPDPE